MTSQTPTRAVASHAFVAETEVELSLQVGDVVTIRREAGDGWTEGELGGVIGLFPSDYVDLLDAESSDGASDAAEKTRTALGLVPRPQSVAPKRPSTSRETSQRPSVSPPEAPVRPSVSPPEAPVRPSVSPPEAPVRPSVSLPEAPVRPSVSPPEAPVRPSASPETPVRPSISRPALPTRAVRPASRPVSMYQHSTQPDPSQSQPQAPSARPSRDPPTDGPPSNGNAGEAGGHSGHGSGDTGGDVSGRMRQDSGGEAIEIIDGPRGIFWKPTNEAMRIRVTDPIKGSKFGGVKEFVDYEVESTKYNLPVRRRYKRFAWLADVLKENFPGIIIPALPSKQVQGRFHDHFVERRRQALEVFLNRVASHPVLGDSQAFVHFLTATDEKDWKSGKRISEKGAHCSEFLRNVICPPLPEDAGDTLDRFRTFAKKTLQRVAAMISALQVLDSSRAQISKEFEKVGAGLTGLTEDNVNELGEWTWEAAHFDASAQALTKAIGTTGAVMGEVAGITTDAALLDTWALIDALKEYKDILERFPTNIKRYEDAKEQHISATTNKKMDETMVQQLKVKADTLGGIILAEMEEFNRARINDFKFMFESYAKQMVAWHGRLADSWDSALSAFNEVRLKRDDDE